MDLVDYFGIVKKKQSVDHGCLSIKYKPNNVNEWMQNKMQIERIKFYFKQTEKKALVIYGPTSSGKTSIARLISETLQYNIFENTTINKRTRKDLETIFNKICKFTNGVFIIDDVESMFQKNESVSVSFLSELLFNPIVNIKIIIIIHQVYYSKLHSIINNCIAVQLEYPDPKTLFVRCIDILDQEKTTYTDEHLLKIKKVIAQYNCEPRSVIDALSGNMYMDNILECKRIDVDIYDAYRKIVSPTVPLHQKYIAFTIDTGTIPILLQENYIDMNIPDVRNIVNCMSLADIFHKQIFTSISGDFNRFIYFILSSAFHSLYSICNTSSTYYTKPRFGLIWTKQSAMYSKRKYINNACSDIKFKPFVSNNMTMLRVNNLMKHSIKRQTMKTFVTDYNIQSADTAFQLYNSFTLYDQVYKEKAMIRKNFLCMFKTTMS